MKNPLNAFAGKSELTDLRKDSSGNPMDDLLSNSSVEENLHPERNPDIGQAGAAGSITGQTEKIIVESVTDEPDDIFITKGDCYEEEPS